MKATVGRWTAIQTKLPFSTAGDDLWRKLEKRTVGKRGQANVNIALTADELAMVKEAEHQLEEQYGKYVEMAG